MGGNIGKLFGIDPDCDHVLNPKGDLLQTAFKFLPIAGAVGGGVIGFIVPLPNRERLIVGGSLATAGYFLGKSLVDADPEDGKYTAAALGAGAVSLAMGFAEVDNLAYVIGGAAGGGAIGYFYLAPVIAPVVDVGQGVMKITNVFGIGTRAASCLLGKIPEAIDRDVEYDFRDCKAKAPENCACWQQKYPNHAWRERAGDLCIGVPCYARGKPPDSRPPPASIVSSGGDWDGKARALWKPNCTQQKRVDKMLARGVKPDSCYCHEGQLYDTYQDQLPWRHVLMADSKGNPTCRVVSWDNTQKALLTDKQSIKYVTPCNFSDAEYDRHIANVNKTALKAKKTIAFHIPEQYTYQFSDDKWKKRAGLAYSGKTLHTIEEERAHNAAVVEANTEYAQLHAAAQKVWDKCVQVHTAAGTPIPPKQVEQFHRYQNFLEARVQAVRDWTSPPPHVDPPQGCEYAGPGTTPDAQAWYDKKNAELQRAEIRYANAHGHVGGKIRQAEIAYEEYLADELTARQTGGVRPVPVPFPAHLKPYR